MKLSQVLLFLAFQICWIASSAQSPYDGECIIGSNGFKATFQTNSALPIIDTLAVTKSAYWAGSSSIADRNGKLIIGCSAHDIYDRTGDTMKGGFRISYPNIASETGSRSPWPQSSIILPKKGDEYYVFTTTMSDSAWDDWDNGFNFRFDILSYHVVDMKGNNGLGEVTKRKQILMQDARLSHNRMTAVRHGNGRDWWLVKPHQTKHLFYLFLISADGISGPIEKSVNLPDITGISGLFGQSTFNRTGDKYAYCTWATDGVFVLNFDRCTGDFSPYHYYPIPTRNPSLRYDFASGTCFSPDGKLLYANSANAIYQIELSDTSANSVQFIHGPDVPPDSLNYFPQYLNINLGADDKLYLNNTDGIRNEISFIEKPNERGQSCNFCERCLYVGNINAKGLPNMPYYHLGRKEGSECDTLIPPPPPSPIPPKWNEIKVYPNPFSNELKVFLPLDSAVEVKVVMHNALGQVILKQDKTLDAKQEFLLDMSGLVQGMYILDIMANGQEWQEKVVKE